RAAGARPGVAGRRRSRGRRRARWRSGARACGRRRRGVGTTGLGGALSRSLPTHGGSRSRPRRRSRGALADRRRPALGRDRGVTGDGVRRLTAASGLVAAAVVAVGAVLQPGDAPGFDALPEQVVRWTLDDRRRLLASSAIVAVGLSLLIVFYAGL